MRATFIATSIGKKPWVSRLQYVDDDKNKTYEPGVEGARRWFLDNTAAYIAGCMAKGRTTNAAKPTKAQRRLLTLLGLEIPITKEMAGTMLRIAGYYNDGMPRFMNRQATEKLTDEQLHVLAHRAAPAGAIPEAGLFKGKR